MGVKIASARHLLSCHRKTQVAVFTRGLSVYRITIVSSCSLFVNRESLKNDSRFFFCSTSRNNSNSVTIQWGSLTGAMGGGDTFIFPRTFTSIYSVQLCTGTPSGGSGMISRIGTVTTSRFTQALDSFSSQGATIGVSKYWIAVGVS